MESTLRELLALYTFSGLSSGKVSSEFCVFDCGTCCINNIFVNSNYLKPFFVFGLLCLSNFSHSLRMYKTIKQREQ